MKTLIEIDMNKKKAYNFSATLLFTCEAKSENEVWKQFNEYLFW